MFKARLLFPTHLCSAGGLPIPAPLRYVTALLPEKDFVKYLFPTLREIFEICEIFEKDFVKHFFSTLLACFSAHTLPPSSPCNNFRCGGFSSSSHAHSRVYPCDADAPRPRLHRRYNRFQLQAHWAPASHFVFLSYLKQDPPDFQTPRHSRRHLLPAIKLVSLSY